MGRGTPSGRGGALTYPDLRGTRASGYRGRISPLAPLAHPRFRALWLASLASFLGTWVHNTAARWTATTLSGRPAIITAVDTLQLIPMMLLGVWAGRWADRHDRRQILLATQAGLTGTALLLAIADWTGHLTIPVLLALTALLGVFGAMNGPAWQATLPRQVPDHEVPRAVVLMSTAFNLARAAGPALGAWVLVSLGAGAAFAANALSYAIIARLIHGLPPQPPSPVAEQGSLWPHPKLRRWYLLVGLFGLCANPALSLAPVVARDGLGGGVTEYGRLLTGFGLGAAVAGLGVVAGGERLGRGRFLSVTTALAGVGCLLLASAGSLPWGMLGAALTGVGWIGTIATSNGGIQLAAVEGGRSQAMAWFLTCAVGGQALGALFGGQLADRLGHAAALTGCAAGLLAIAAWVRTTWKDGA